MILTKNILIRERWNLLTKIGEGNMKSRSYLTNFQRVKRKYPTYITLEIILGNKKAR
jgi:hypothetical protein